MFKLFLVILTAGTVLLPMSAPADTDKSIDKTQKIIDVLALDHNLIGLLKHTVGRTETNAMVSTKCPIKAFKLRRDGIALARETHAAEWRKGVSEALRKAFGATWIEKTSNLPKAEMRSAFLKSPSVYEYADILEETNMATLTEATTTAIAHMYQNCFE